MLTQKETCHDIQYCQDFAISELILCYIIKFAFAPLLLNVLDD